MSFAEHIPEVVGFRLETLVNLIVVAMQRHVRFEPYCLHAHEPQPRAVRIDIVELVDGVIKDGSFQEIPGIGHPSETHGLGDLPAPLLEPVFLLGRHPRARLILDVVGYSCTHEGV